MKSMSRLALFALVAIALVRPAAGQVPEDRSHRWYWGATVGGFAYKTNDQGYFIDPIMGVHWLITGKRTALYIGGEQAFLLTEARATVVDQNTGSAHDVTFDQVRRLFIGLMAYPLQQHIEPFAGVGVGLVTIQNPTADCSGATQTAVCATPADAVNAEALAQSAGSKAVGWAIGGVQINVGKLAVFGQYMVNSAANNFLLSGATHTFSGGIRYSFGSSKEDVTSEH
jgi:opacity protein-like surface antigen